MEENQRIYTVNERRKVVAAVHNILNTKGNLSRYSGTRFGIGAADDFNDPKALGFYDLLDCLAQMYKEMTAAEKEVQNDG